jgi:hypothetical protein
MDFLITLLDFFLHLDVHLGEIIRNYGGWTYAILFLIIFMETGLVVTPFLALLPPWAHSTPFFSFSFSFRRPY